jgi:hypothetical protein
VRRTFHCFCDIFAKNALSAIYQKENTTCSEIEKYPAFSKI